jgi:hypothetical protein
VIDDLTRPPGGSAVKLTRSERREIFAGTLKVLTRPEKPAQEAGTTVVVSYTRGGRQVVDRETGATIDVPRQPRIWIVVKGWHLRAGKTDWETEVVIHDRREHHRVLSNGLGGLPREAGLKTRWRETVDAEGNVRPKRVPERGEQREHWTPETERGYGGRSEMEAAADGDLVSAAAVDDATLDDFSRRVAEENELKQTQQRRTAKQFEREARLAETRSRGMSRASAGIERQLRAVDPQPKDMAA